MQFLISAIASQLRAKFEVSLVFISIAREGDSGASPVVNENIRSADFTQTCFAGL